MRKKSRDRALFLTLAVVSVVMFVLTSPPRGPRWTLPFGVVVLIVGLTAVWFFTWPDRSDEL
jgi:hypothetical protein